MLAAEYQESTWMLCVLPWSGWRGCYVILHVKPLDFGHIRAHIIITLLMIWYHRHFHVGMIWYRPRLYEGIMWYHPGL